MLNMKEFLIILIPFVGTVLGAACVYFMKNGISRKTEQGLSGFAAGVMVAASVWSLIPHLHNHANEAEGPAEKVPSR